MCPLLYTRRRRRRKISDCSSTVNCSPKFISLASRAHPSAAALFTPPRSAQVELIGTQLSYIRDEHIGLIFEVYYLYEAICTAELSRAVDYERSFLYIAQVWVGGENFSFGRGALVRLRVFYRLILDRYRRVGALFDAGTFFLMVVSSDVLDQLDEFGTGNRKPNPIR